MGGTARSRPFVGEIFLFYQKERIAVSYHLSTVGKEYANQRYFELRENQIPNAWQFACS